MEFLQPEEYPHFFGGNRELVAKLIQDLGQQIESFNPDLDYEFSNVAYGLSFLLKKVLEQIGEKHHLKYTLNQIKQNQLSEYYETKRT